MTRPAQGRAQDQTQGRARGDVPRRSVGWARALLLGGAALSAALPLASWAQEEDRPPGTLLTFSLSERLEADSNAALSTLDERATTSAATVLGFSLESETRVSSLSISANATARVASGEDQDTETSFDGPVFDLDYARQVPDASLSLGASYRSDDLEFVRSLQDFIDDEGTLPDDIEDLQGTGTRESTSLDAALTLRDEAPFGISLSASLDDLDYTDTDDPDLQDSRRVTLGTGFRFTFSEVTEANLGLRFSRFEEEGEEERETTGLDLGIDLERPNGAIFADLTVDETEDGRRGSLTFGRELTLPRGGLSASLGVSRDSEGDLGPSGSLAYSQDFPLGSFGLAVEREIRTGSDDDEELVTNLSADYERALTPLTSLSLDALYVDSRPTDTEETTRDLSLGATVSRSLTPDWSLSLGYRHRVRDEDEEGRASNDSVFLSLSRSFQRVF